MINAFRVVALAAASAFLCPVAASAAEREPASILTESAAAPMFSIDTADATFPRSC